MAEDKKARYRDISDGLLRQRRNLMLVSIAMPLFFVSGAEVEKLNILGTVIVLSNPKVVEYLLVVLFLYFFLRYWQYYKEESYISDMKRKIIDYTVVLETRFLTKKANQMTSFVKSTDYSIHYTDSRYHRFGRPVHIPVENDRVTFLFMRECKFYIYPKTKNGDASSTEIKEFGGLSESHSLSNWSVIESPEDFSKRTYNYYGNVIHYSIFRFNLYRTIGYLKYMLNESYFTDYQLPFAIALVSIIGSSITVFI
ncbi:hypothetical protein [Vibrio sp. 10N.222.47.A9]|uniref:hypothetical protein n=1 Tax=Vibrio sp. 10N.222.47.A9 TaxID=1903178 RepID=UPI001055B7C4|nr:hypothetical protein [Vibrio sp. 10N.222.47.A9]